MVFSKKLPVTAAQLVAFRAITGMDTSKTSNTRDIQTNANTVYHRKASVDSNVGTILGATLLGVGTFGAVYNFLTQEQTSKALTANPVIDFLQDFEERFLTGSEPADERHGGYSPNPHHHPQELQY